MCNVLHPGVDGALCDETGHLTIGADPIDRVASQCLTDIIVDAHRLIAHVQHVRKDGDAAGNVKFTQSVERSQHALSVGFIRIIQHIARSQRNQITAQAGLLYIGQSFQDLCLAHAQRSRDIDAGQCVHHLMLAIDVHGCRLCQQIAVKGNAAGILRDIPIGKQILPFIMTKALHRSSPRQLLLPQRQLEHILFPIEQKHAVFLQTVHDLRFCAGDIFDGPQIFQMCFSDPNQGLASAQYISEQNLGENVYIIWKNDDVYSTGIKDQFVAEAEELGLNIVGNSTFTTDTSNDFTVQLTDAQQKGADLVFLPMYYEPASLILTQADAMGYEPKFFGVDGMDGILTMEGFDASLAEGVMLLTPFNADATDDATVAFVTEYESLYGETPNQFAADGYDCIYALKLALETAGCTPDMTAEAINDALIAAFPTITLTGLTGDGEGITWDSTGAVSKAPKGMVIENGAYVGMD